jgi:ABC-type multidrug transport system fused ATPase/permease subunit
VSVHAAPRIRPAPRVITVAHRASLAADADLVVMLDTGRVVEQGTHRELLARSPAYRELLQAG